MLKTVVLLHIFVEKVIFFSLMNRNSKEQHLFEIEICSSFPAGSSTLGGKNPCSRIFGQSLPAIALVTRSSFWMGSFSELYLMVNSVDWCLANGCFICLQQPVDKNHSTVSQSVKDGFICVWVQQLSLKLYMSETAKHYVYLEEGICHED